MGSRFVLVYFYLVVFEGVFLGVLIVKSSCELGISDAYILFWISCLCLCLLIVLFVDFYLFCFVFSDFGGLLVVYCCILRMFEIW